MLVCDNMYLEVAGLVSILFDLRQDLVPLTFPGDPVHQYDTMIFSHCHMLSTNLLIMCPFFPGPFVVQIIALLARPYARSISLLSVSFKMPPPPAFKLSSLSHIYTRAALVFQASRFRSLALRPRALPSSFLER